MVSPILFLVFNRPHLTQLVFNSIAKAQPKKLYIAADGPRNEEERSVCEAVRHITEQITWDCEVKRLYRTKNLGCREAVIEAINWFFTQEESGIIIEDDCLPISSFFDFCTSMLALYPVDETVKTISGSNFLFGKKDDENDYFFLNYTMIWGWATWRRAWTEIDWSFTYNMEEVIEKIHLTYSNTAFRDWILNMISTYYFNPDTAKETWDVQLLVHYLMKDGLSIIPSRNLVTNIGVYGTRDFKESKSIKAATKEISVLKLPNKQTIEISEHIQRLFMSNVVAANAPANSFLHRIRQLITFFHD